MKVLILRILPHQIEKFLNSRERRKNHLIADRMIGLTVKVNLERIGLGAKSVAIGAAVVGEKAVLRLRKKIAPKQMIGPLEARDQAALAKGRLGKKVTVTSPMAEVVAGAGLKAGKRHEAMEDPLRKNGIQRIVKAVANYLYLLSSRTSGHGNMCVTGWSQ